MSEKNDKVLLEFPVMWVGTAQVLKMISDLRATQDKCNSYILDNARLEAENKKLRHLLFVAHGSPEHYLYGDDGERTCNTCMVDFKRDSAEEIERKINDYNMRKLAQILPEWAARVGAVPEPKRRSITHQTIND